MNHTRSRVAHHDLLRWASVSGAMGALKPAVSAAVSMSFAAPSRSHSRAVPCSASTLNTPSAEGLLTSSMKSAVWNEPMTM